MEALREARARPRVAEAQGQLGMILHAYQQYEHAAICYERARRLDPNVFSWVYYLATAQAAAGNHAAAGPLFKEALQLRADYLPALLRLADSLFINRALSESEQLYERAVKIDPNSAWAHYGLGRVRAARGDLDRAVSHYERALELSKDFGSAHYALGIALRDAGQLARAQDHLALSEKNKLIRPKLNDPLLDAVEKLNTGAIDHYNKGLALEAAGQLEEAVAAYGKALEINPRLVQAHVNLISLHGRLNRYESAEKHYRAAAGMSHNLAEGEYNYGVLLVRQEKLSEAAAAFRRAIEINPFYAEAHYNYGLIVERGGQLAEAARHYRAAIENRPNFRQAHFQIGRILVRENRLAEAITHFLHTLAPEDADTPRFMYALAAAYARAGDHRRALSYARGARQRAAALNQIELLKLIERDLRILSETTSAP